MYRVTAELRNDLVNTNNTKRFEITDSRYIAGRQSYNLRGQKFDVTGLNLPDNGYFRQSYTFIVEFDSSNNIRPIMIVNYNNGYGYGYIK